MAKCGRQSIHVYFRHESTVKIYKKPSQCWDSQPSVGIFGNFFNFRQIVYLLANGRSSASRCLVMGVATRRYKNLRIVIVIIIIMLGSRD